MKSRDYYKLFWREFKYEKHLVLVSGPRQAGKTTLAKDIAAEESTSLYFNYDIPDNRVLIHSDPLFFQKTDRPKGTLPLIILDEIHKYGDWKNYLKGIYDGFSDGYRFLITGSGRLDLSQKRGDSLAGRYLQFRLFPFTIGELFAKRIGQENLVDLLEIPEKNQEAQEAWETFFHVSGFPEPFLGGTKQKYRRWAKSYHNQVIRNDIRDEFAVRQIDKMEVLYQLISNCIGSPFSSASLSQNIKVAHKTVSSWISVFERFFLLFQIPPYSKRITRSLVKGPKVYFYDYCRILDDAKRFENMIAVELSRAVSLWNDFGLGDFKLWYLRNKEKEEVDFLITESGSPQIMIEAKLSKTEISPHLLKFQKMLNIPAIQLVNKAGVARKIKNGPNEVFVISAWDWLACLN